MDALKQWAFSICCAMVGCGIAHLILPKSNMEKMFKLCVSVFFLCCLLSPLVLHYPSLRIEWQETTQEDILRRASQLEDVVDRQADQAAGESLKKIVEDKLWERGINHSGVTIHINTNGQHGGQVPIVEITLGTQYDESQRETIRQELSEDLALEVRLR